MVDHLVLKPTLKYTEERHSFVAEQICWRKISVTKHGPAEGRSEQHPRQEPADMVQYMVEENKLTQVPPEFIKPPQERRKSTTIEAGKLIHVIDMPLLEDAQGKEKVMAEAVRACEEWGFLQVINPGVSETLMDAAMEMTMRFFALPSVEKEEFKIRELVGLSYGRFFYNPGGTKDWVGRLVVCAVHKGVLESYDLVVTNPTNFQAVLEEYGDTVHKLAKDILSVLSEGVGQSSNLFSSQFAGLEAVAVQTGLHFYPPCPQPELVMGASSHADVSVVAVLQQDQVSGLEVLQELLGAGAAHQACLCCQC